MMINRLRSLQSERSVASSKNEYIAHAPVFVGVWSANCSGTVPVDKSAGEPLLRADVTVVS